jgi:hypothetical protein
MSIAARIAVYKERNFSNEQIIALVLMEQTAAILFREFPDAFVLFGGATLVLLHDSPRHSGDLDLHGTKDTFPNLADIERVLKTEIGPIAEAMKLGELKIEREVEGKDFVRLWVIAANNNARLFSVDLSKMGTVLQQQVTEQKVEAATIEQSVKAPSENLLLLQKAEVFLQRPRVKARDAFDIAYLLGRGATLNENLQQHLEDHLRWNELDSDDIKERIEKAIELVPAELKAYLPEKIYKNIEADNFLHIRNALESTFVKWL